MKIINDYCRSRQFDNVIRFSPFYASVPLLEYNKNDNSKGSCSLSLFSTAAQLQSSLPSSKGYPPYQKCFLMLINCLSKYVYCLGSIRVVWEHFLVCLNHQVFCASNWCVLLELGWSANLWWRFCSLSGWVLMLQIFLPEPECFPWILTHVPLNLPSITIWSYMLTDTLMELIAKGTWMQCRKINFF